MVRGFEDLNTSLCLIYSLLARLLSPSFTILSAFSNMESTILFFVSPFIYSFSCKFGSFLEEEEEEEGG